MDGLLIVDKPEGKSSHAVVYTARKLLHEDHIGHAGTLDPMATGVLVLCIGAGARIAEYLVDHDKAYRATVRLGVETDTYDATGTPLAARPVIVTREQVEAALASLVGPQEQTPPAFSAIKVGGVRQYQRARQGETVELAPRHVEIYAIAVRACEADRVEIDVRCSKGTYIRSLAHDLGARLGTGAHLSALRRLASGPFLLEQAHTLDEIALAASRGVAGSLLLPFDVGLRRFPPIALNDAEADSVCHGRAFPIPLEFADTTTLVRAYAPDGRCIALLAPQGTRFQPVKVFPCRP